MKKVFITIMMLALFTTTFGQADVTSFNANLQVSSEGLYGGLGVTKDIIINNRFMFKPNIYYFYHFGETKQQFQHNHLRLGVINLTYRYRNFYPGFTMGTLLPTERKTVYNGWGYEPFYSISVEYRHERISYYTFVDGYRVSKPMIKFGINFKIGETEGI